MSDMERWRGKVAVVTGASSGIGAEVARRLASEGMRVAICARRLEPLQALAEEIQAGGGHAMAMVADLRVESDIVTFFDTVRSRWGCVDVLVNNAGLGRDASLLDGDPEDWREMLELNVLALCIATRLATACMRGREVAGHIIHVGSMAGHRVPPGSGVYSASKFAVRSLTEGLRQELRAIGSPIRVSCISPGYVETGFAATWHRDEGASEATYGQYEVLQPEDVADAVAWTLATPPRVQVHDLLLRPTQQQG